ncbi:MAG: DUF3187 family protein [Granulosicoccus sp.]
MLASLTLLHAGLATAEQGDDSVFFQQRSQHAYNAVFGLPAAAPRLVQTVEWQVSVEHSNQFTGGQSGSDSLRLDGETTRVDLRHRQRLAACWQFTANVPLIAHSEGKFDRAIDDWHTFFGLPDANRAGTDFGTLNYEFSNATGLKHAIDRPQSGIGDVQFALQRALGCFATADSTKAESILRLGIKLPTGNPAELRGSGAADVFIDWQSRLWSDGRWHSGFALGLLLNGQTEKFAEQERIAIYGSFGAQYLLYQQLRLVAQLDGHSAFYKSELRELGDPAINLAVGARYLISRAYTFELSISEDVAIDTTPDIVARLALTYRPNQAR